MEPSHAHYGAREAEGAVQGADEPMPGVRGRATAPDAQACAGGDAGGAGAAEAALAEDATAEEVVAELDRLHEQKRFADVHALTAAAVRRFPRHVEVVWRHARSYYDLANERMDDKAYRQRMLKKGLGVARESVQLDEQHFATHKWFAIFTSAYGEFLPLKEKILSSHTMKQHAEIASRLKPTDASTLHLLGRLCFTIADVSWMERQVASRLIATPPKATFKEALEYFLKADALKQAEGFKQNGVWVGHTYAKLGKKKLAAKWYKKTIDMPTISNADRAFSEEAAACLKRL